MLIRALIVLLVVLNLGVAGWWISRPAAQPPAPPQQPQGVARLQLASEAATSRATTIAARAQTATPAATPAPAEEKSVEAKPAEAKPGVAAETAIAAPQCFSLGPFATDAAAKAAIDALRADIARSGVREVEGASSGAYTVFLPPSEDRAAAQSLAQRIAAAGFDDFMIVNEGELANGIALGLYRNRNGAERRQAALQAGGFPAQIRDAGEKAPSQWWADIATEKGMNAVQARTKAGATRTQALDCAALR